MTSLFQQPHEIVTEILMSRDRVPWLVVEGDSDERVFRSRRFKRDVKIVVAVGWAGVRDVLVGANDCEHNTIVLGVIDRDYRDLNASQPIVQGLIFTDLRDMEGLMFWSSALHRVYCELGSLSKLPKSDGQDVDYGSIRTQIISTCESLGRFRAHCFVSGLNVSLQDLDYGKFVCDRSLQVDVTKFLNHVRGRNNGAYCISEAGWHTSQSEDGLGAVVPADEKILCHGHDLMAVVAVSLRRMWGSKGGAIGREDVESAFRIGMSDEEFESTEMWARLSDALQA